MSALTFILVIIFLIALLLSYQSNLTEKNSFDIVNEMGIGYNLGNSFDSYNNSIQINNPEEQITLMGNPTPTKKLISNIKKYGFKSIRFPVTWSNFIDNFGNVKSEWMSRVKEVVKWIIGKNMYCILNLYHDSDEGNWLSEGMKAKDKYINLWTRIAEEFKDYNEYLVFEAINKPFYINKYLYYEYDILYNLTQIFIDTLRNSGGYNVKRLLILPCMNSDMELSCKDNFKIPSDPANNSAITFHYYHPYQFTTSTESNYDNKNNWGSENDYKKIISHFEIMKNCFLDKNIPIIIGEIGVITEENRDKISIREYLYTIFSLSFDNEGILPCLWDTSNKKTGNMNFYDREKDEWYDEKLKDIFVKFEKKRNIKSSEFYVVTNTETTVDTSDWGDYFISLNNRTPLKIILNASYKGELFEDYDFSVTSLDKNGDFFEVQFGKTNGKKQYDGTIIYTFDVSNRECYDFIEIIIWFGDYFNFNNVTVEYKESFTIFDYKAYKAEILKEIT